MPFEDLPSRLEDILDAIEDIQAFVAGRSFDDYPRDTMLRLPIDVASRSFRRHRVTFRRT
jgi:hypothetical protein